MPTSANEIVTRMRQSLAITEPDLDTSIGTTVRKILDSVAEVVAEASIDTYLLDYQYDIETKGGADLDDFVSLFGFNRYQAKRATGVVVFGRSTGATTIITIPFGSQIATEDPTPVVVSTLVPAILLPDQENVSVPVQALLGGGQGNTPANSLRRRITPLQGIGSIDNPAALTGGADQETDAQLRDRFKRTVFRNLAGTEHMFLATALDHPSVTHANVIGAGKRHREQIQVVDGIAIPELSGYRYIYLDTVVVGADIDAGQIYAPGVAYDVAIPTGIGPLQITATEGSPMEDGDVVDVEFLYVPLASRNDPENGITNRVDIWVNGNKPTEGKETLAFQDDPFSDDTGSWLDRQNFRRLDGTMPNEGNTFVRFGLGPVTDPSVNGTIQIGVVTYAEDVDYWLVNDMTATGGTPTSPSGIELDGGAAAVQGDIAALEYVYNAVPREVDRAVRVWRLVTSDVQVHAARPMYLNLHFAIMYTPGFDPGGVQNEINQALSAWMANIGMNGVVQTSDLLTVAGQVAGVDAIRFLHSLDAMAAFQAETYPNVPDDFLRYGIQRVTSLGDVMETYVRPIARFTAMTNLSGPTTLPVDSTAGFPEIGSLHINGWNYTYGGITPTSFLEVTGPQWQSDVGTVVHLVSGATSPRDVLVGEDEYPVMNSTSFTQKAQNTFHSI